MRAVMQEEGRTWEEEGDDDDDWEDRDRWRGSVVR
jgi:hypothetical protein